MLFLKGMGNAAVLKKSVKHGLKKGEVTKQAILDQALRLASKLGLEGLSIGGLAQELRLSKSGLFAHFQSKEKLQLKVLDAASVIFNEVVIKPSIKFPRGVQRLEALFENWLTWAKSKELSGGCIFIAASVEMDDRPGSVRDHLVKISKQWLDCRKRVIQTCVDRGEFRADSDVDQLAHEFYGITLAYHHASKLLSDADAERKARTALKRFIEFSKA